MEWPDAVNLLKHWSRHPPTNELVAVFLGAEPKDAAADDAAADAAVNTVSGAEFNSLLEQHGLKGLL